VRGALVALVACLLACLSAPVARAKEAPGPPLAELRAVLKARTDAIRAKDRDAYASTIDPNAPPTFRDAQLRSFDGLASLPVARVNYSIRRDTSDLTRAVIRNEYANAPVALVPTVQALRFTYDARSSLDVMFWTFVKRGDHWFVGGDDDVADLGLESTVSMWDRGPVVAVASEHFQFIAHPAQRPRAQDLLQLSEQALATLASRWTLPWSGKLVGFVPGSPAEIADLIQATVDVTKFVAFVAYGFDPDTLQPTTPRMYVQDANLSVYPPAAQTETLLHELTHAAGSDFASSFTPAWVHEGLAEWVATGTTNRFPRGASAGAHAPRDDEFGAGSQAQIVRAYRDARSLIAALSRIGGAQSPFAFFQALGAERVRVGSTPYVVDDSLRKVGVADLATLERDWAAGK
jgi:hypothetical protein